MRGMPSDIFKEPKRTKKHTLRKARILYGKQYRNSELRSRLYQNAVFYTHGADRLVVATLSAIGETIEFFNKQYKDTLHIRHACAILCVKQCVLLTQRETIQAKDIEANFEYVLPFICAFTHNGYKRNVLGRILSDLEHLHFLNVIKEGAQTYTPTTRIKFFCMVFEKNMKKYFPQEG